MPAGKKKETKKSTPKKAIVSNESSIITRLEVVEKMLLITRDEAKDMSKMIKRLNDRMGL